jgi:hypothetical protein
MWGSRRGEAFSSALEAESVTGLDLKHFLGAAAHPDRDPDISIR